LKNPLLKTELTALDLAKLKKLADMFDYVGEIDGSVMLKVKGEFRLVCDKDIIFMSGQDDNPDRPGYRHSIWENPPLNERGQPLMMITVRDSETGEYLDVPARFREDGKLILKAGQIAPPEFYSEADVKSRYRIPSES
jgi:hypothetical protein